MSTMTTSDYNVKSTNGVFKQGGTFGGALKRFGCVLQNRLRRKTEMIKTPTINLARNALIIFLSAFILPTKRAAIASGGLSPPIKTGISPVQGIIIWACLFVVSAVLHSAESAITKISTWKVQEFAEQEGPQSPFAAMSSNLTRLLSTILLTTTACSIYSTALFVGSAEKLFPNASLGTITAILTAVTLFFGEYMPKALAVSNSELVARTWVPIISQLATVLLPFTSAVTFLSDILLTLAGLKNKAVDDVSEDMLRMVVDEAQRTESIETGEGRMIKAVLDMQDKEVEKIMQPRVDIVAVAEGTSATDILKAAIRTKYSRIPVYKGDIDNIVGVLFVKDLLDYMNIPDEKQEYKVRPQMNEMWGALNATSLMEPTYFIPETMTVWTALQEMRKRRIHVAIIVDEYGGTSGLVTFEDILEEVVGEIYDEDDDEEQADDSKTIFKGASGSYFEMKGYAELDDVCEALGLNLEQDILEEHSTIGGLLCEVAGQIPKEGDSVLLGGYVFTVQEVLDNRRIISLSAELQLSDLHDGERERQEEADVSGFDGANSSSSVGSEGNNAAGGFFDKSSGVWVATDEDTINFPNSIK